MPRNVDLFMRPGKPDLTGRRQVVAYGVDARWIDYGPFCRAGKDMRQYFFKFIQPVLYFEGIVYGVRVYQFPFCLEKEDFIDRNEEFLLPLKKREQWARQVLYVRLKFCYGIIHSAAADNHLIFRQSIWYLNTQFHSNITSFDGINQCLETIIAARQAANKSKTAAGKTKPVSGSK